MTAPQTRKIALSLAIATPSLMQSIPASATMAPDAQLRQIADERVEHPTTEDSRSRLLARITSMSPEEKQAVGGDRVVLAGNFASNVGPSACATGGIWCRGGQWSNGCTCAVTRRIVAKPRG